MLALSDITSRGLIASALGLAILFYGGPTQILQLGVVTLLLFGVLARLSWSLKHQKIFWSTSHTVLLVYAAYLVLNIYLSEFAENSLLVTWLFLVMPMVVLVAGRVNDEYWKILLPLLCLPMAVSIAWGFTEFFLTTGRASGPVLDPNSWASGLNLFFFAIAAWFFRAGGRTASLLFIFQGACAAAVFMAYSRVGTLIFFIAFGFVSMLALSFPIYRRRGVALLLVVATAYFSVTGYRSSEQATRHSEGYTLDIQSAGWSQRIAQWQSGLAQAGDYPIFGSGLGTFKVLYPTYRSLDDARTAGNYVHNDYIQLLAEAGPPLLFFLVLALGFLAWNLSRSVWRAVNDRSKRDFEIALLIVALGTVCVHATMNFSFYTLVNQLIMGCVLARLLWLLGETKEHKLQVTSPWLVRIGLVVGLTYILTLNVADAISSDLVYNGGRLPLDRNKADDQLLIYETLSTIRKIRGENSANRFAMAIFYRTSFDDQPLDNIEGRQSLAIVTALEYQAGLESNPYSLHTRKHFAEFLVQNPWLMEHELIYQTPDKLLRGALALAPFQISRHLMLAEHLQSTGREDEAYELLKRALTYTPMRYDDFKRWRIDLYVALLREAVKRQDQPMLEKLLVAIDTY